ncbi:hypothetical protein [Endozoicomonas arenosclerae]|uniref:hypothetical protein n=1 Tax=Endozoicomonas arenosclerae TaxID=1633495 RepID=UPI000AC65B08|nr:hypothetical protein [Endozoicomonas arenosclerae]
MRIRNGSSISTSIPEKSTSVSSDDSTEGTSGVKKHETTEQIPQPDPHSSKADEISLYERKARLGSGMHGAVSLLEGKDVENNLPPVAMKEFVHPLYKENEKSRHKLLQGVPGVIQSPDEPEKILLMEEPDVDGWVNLDLVGKTQLVMEVGERFDPSVHDPITVMDSIPDVYDAIAKMHQLGFVHGDLTVPENILRLLMDSGELSKQHSQKTG